MKQIIILISIVNLFTLQSCWLYRGARIGKQDVEDYKKLPKVNFKKNANRNVVPLLQNTNPNYAQLLQPLLKNSYITGSLSYGFMVLKNNEVVFEKYYNGKNAETIFPSFSLTKSITATLFFMAIDEGKIESIYDPVTKYLPFLENNDTRFSNLTLHEILNMRSVVKFKDPTGTGNDIKPFSKFAKLAIGRNHNKWVKKLKLKNNPSPNTNFYYQNINSQIIAMVIEKATGLSLKKYFIEKLWKPLGMQGKGSWNMDDRMHKKVKGFAAINMKTSNYARLGKLWCNYGNYNGKQLLQKKWVDSLKNGNINYTNFNDGYQLHFWKDDVQKNNFSNFNEAMRYYNNFNYNKNMLQAFNGSYNVYTIDPSFSAQGSYGQVIYCNPITNTVVVHNGWHNGFTQIINACKQIDNALK